MLADGEPDRLALARLGDRDALLDRDGDRDALLDRDGDRDALARDGDLLRLADLDTEDEEDPPRRLADPLRVTEAVVERERDVDALAVAAAALTLRVALALPLALGMRLGRGLPDPLGDSDEEAEGVRDTVADTLMLRLPDPLRVVEREKDTERDSEVDADSLGDSVADRDTVRDRDSDGVTLDDRDTDGVLLGDGALVPLRDGVSDGDGDGDADPDSDTVGVRLGEPGGTVVGAGGGVATTATVKGSVTRVDWMDTS